MLHYQAVWTVTHADPYNLKRGWGSPLFQTPANKECTYCSLIPRPTQLSIISSIFHSHGESLEKKTTPLLLGDVNEPHVICELMHTTTVKPLITDPPKSGQHLYSGRLTCPRLILP